MFLLSDPYGEMHIMTLSSWLSFTLTAAAFVALSFFVGTGITLLVIRFG